jgi:hypothetical protein
MQCERGSEHADGGVMMVAACRGIRDVLRNGSTPLFPM